MKGVPLLPNAQLLRLLHRHLRETRCLHSQGVNSQAHQLRPSRPAAAARSLIMLPQANLLPTRKFLSSYAVTLDLFTTARPKSILLTNLVATTDLEKMPATLRSLLRKSQSRLVCPQQHQHQGPGPDGWICPRTLWLDLIPPQPIQ